MRNTHSTSVKGKTGVRVCQKSNVISKKVHSLLKSSLQTTEYGPYECQLEDVFPIAEMPEQLIENCEAIHNQYSQHGENFQFQKQASSIFNSAAALSMDSTDTCLSKLDTISSPVMELSEVLNESNIYRDAGGDNDFYVPRLGADDSTDISNSFDYRTCSMLDFCTSDIVISSLPFEKDSAGMYCLSNDTLFDLSEHYTILPHLENVAQNNNSCNPRSYQETMLDPCDSGFYLAKEEVRFTMGESIVFDLEKEESCDPQLLFRTLPELSDVMSNFQPSVSPKETQKRKPITIVLDLDETLVHSTMEQCEDADFTFTIFFNMKEHTIYVKKRPHLHTFLERVAELFEVVIFTASQSIYAEQILNILDPDGKFISRRAYRDSCIFSDGIYTKDLTVLGVDLAKIAIIDNSPQVFRLQVNNGIPIQSWFDDQSDSALISLLPFLETLAEAEDVRSLIAKKFGNKE